ncbi:SH3 domain-containing protein [Gemmatimonadota bacterium]
MIRITHIIVTLIFIGGIASYSWIKEDDCKVIYSKAREYQAKGHYNTASIAYEYTIIKYQYSPTSFQSRLALSDLSKKHLSQKRYAGSFKDFFFQNYVDTYQRRPVSLQNMQLSHLKLEVSDFQKILIYKFPPYISNTTLFLFAICSFFLLLCTPKQKHKLPLFIFIFLGTIVYIVVYEAEVLVSFGLVLLTIPFLFTKKIGEDSFKPLISIQLIAGFSALLLSFFLVSYSWDTKLWESNDSGVEGYINVEAANVRTGPGTEYNKIRILHRGTRFKVIGEKNNWYKIELNDGKMAWVSGRIIQLQK